MHRRAIVAAVMLWLLAAAPAAAAPALTSVGTFDQPVHVAAPAGDARLFVVERPGRVQVVAGGQREVFLDATADVNDAGGEQGLLSIAFAPDYETSGRFFVFYTAANGELTVRAGTRTANPNRGQLDPAALFTVAHPGADNHNGGQLAFGPDGALYASTGDGGGQGDPGDDAQTPGSLLGKILRVPPGGGPPQVWALGLRNPWRFSFDRVTGDMIIGDVGGSVNEEIDFAPNGTPAGRNYGWVRCEGDQPTCPAGTTRPVLNLPRGNDAFTGVIGGFLVRDPEVPCLNGRYVFGDLSQRTVLSVALGAERTPRPEPTLPVTSPTSFGEDGFGHVYVATYAGPVYRIREDAPTSCPGTTPPPGSNPAGDTRPCALSARGTGRAQRILRRGKRLRLRLRSDEACRVTLRARRFRTKQAQLRPGVRRVVRLTPTKKGLRKLRRAAARSDRHRVRVTVRIRTRDAAGNGSAARVRPRVR